MNSRQHELEENIVAEGLASFLKKIEPYTKLILVVFVVLVAALVGYGLYTSGQTAKRSDATLQLLMNNPEVAMQYPGTSAAAWAMLFEADQNLAQGISALYQDRDEAETLLAQAKDQFIDARNASENKILISRANYGLGLATESLGEIDEARDAYQRCVDANESEQMVEVAQQRIDRLDNAQTGEFLTWFSEQDFSPADPSLPPELPGASDLPDLPDLELPDLGDDGDAEGSMEETSSGEDPVEPEGSPIEMPETSGTEESGSEESSTVEESGATDETTDAAKTTPDSAQDAEPADEPEPADEKAARSEPEPAAETDSTSGDEASE
jgi:hypothetical protein